jgi:hypothetical protein
MSEDDSGELGPWEYLGYKLIVKIKERSKRQISRSKFLKLNCVADRYLQDELDCDIGLPRYWYKYGEILDEHSTNREYFHAPSARGFSGQQYLTSREYATDEFDITDEEKELIDEAADWIALRFAKRNVEQIKAHQYRTHAPKEFIRAYSELRELLDSNFEEQAILTRYSSKDASNQELVTDLLDEMLMTYPKQRYEDMHGTYLRWDDTARLLVEDEPDYDVLKEFLDDFIEALSKVELRFEHASNVPEDRLDRWWGERDDILNDFERELENRRTSLLKDTEPSGELESVAEGYNEAVVNMMYENGK